MTPEELLKLDGVIAQLRHAYRNVLNANFDTTILRKSFADGLIAPQIRALEALSAQLAAKDAARGEIVEVCPACKALNICCRYQGANTKLRCNECHSHFDEPARYQRLLAPPSQPAQEQP